MIQALIVLLSIIASDILYNIDLDYNDNNLRIENTCTENAVNLVCNHKYDYKLYDLSKLVNIDIIEANNQGNTL